MLKLSSRSAQCSGNLEPMSWSQDVDCLLADKLQIEHETAQEQKRGMVANSGMGADASAAPPLDTVLPVVAAQRVEAMEFALPDPAPPPATGNEVAPYLVCRRLLVKQPPTPAYVAKAAKQQ